MQILITVSSLEWLERLGIENSVYEAIHTNDSQLEKNPTDYRVL